MNLYTLYCTVCTDFLYNTELTVEYRSHVKHSTHCTVCTDPMYNTVYTVQYVQIQCTTQYTPYSMYRSHVQHSTHCTVCTDFMYNTAHTTYSMYRSHPLTHQSGQGQEMVPDIVSD